MTGIFWRTLSRTIDATKQRMKSSTLITRLPFIRYSYLFEYPKTIVVPELKLGFVPTPKVANRSMKIAIASHIGMQYHGDIHHAPWQFTPLISSIQPIQKSPSLWITAVYLFMLIMILLLCEFHSGTNTNDFFLICRGFQPSSLT